MHPIIKMILEFDAYVKSDIPKSLSATTFLSPIQKVILSKRHTSSIDIKLNSASLLGTALHEYFERIIKIGTEFDHEDHHYKLTHQELSMNAPIGNTGFTATGTSDLIFEKDYNLIHIGDYKSCKDYSLKKRDFDKWMKQLSIYAMLTHLTLKKPVDNYGTIFYFNKSSEAVSKFPFGTIVLELMSLKDTRDFIMERTLEFKKYWDAPDDQLPKCTEIENWNGRLCGTYCGYSHVCNQINCFTNGNYNF
jgi:hypothetical protein